MAKEYVDLFFEMPENNNENEKLPIDIFQLIDVELNDALLQNYKSELDNVTDGPIQFI